MSHDIIHNNKKYIHCCLKYFGGWTRSRNSILFDESSVIVQSGNLSATWFDFTPQAKVGNDTKQYSLHLILTFYLKGRAFLRSELTCTSMIIIFKCITLQKPQLRRLWKGVGPFYYPGRSRLDRHGNSRAPPSYLINIKPWRHSDCSLRSRHTQFKGQHGPIPRNPFPANSQIFTFVVKTAGWHLVRRAWFSIGINICSVENAKGGLVLIMYQSSLPKRHWLLPTLAKLLTHDSLLTTGNHSTTHTHVNVNKDLLWITSSEA